MDILITGARSPAALEWARICLRSGHRIHLADSMRWPVSRFLKGIAGYTQLPLPKDNLHHYRTALEELLKSRKIKLVIPTCEEIFHISKLMADIPLAVNWYMPEESLLFGLHNKFESMEILKDLGEVRTPDTRLCRRPEDIVDIEDIGDFILKPVYSRFGEYVIRNPEKTDLASLKITDSNPWVKQKRIIGEQLCNYALFEHGEMLAHQAYTPLHCLNRSAATCFQPIQDERIVDFSKRFGTKTGYHGQVAFDFISGEGGLHVIECNPRATSGIHLLSRALSLGDDGNVSFLQGDIRGKRVGGVVFFLGGLEAIRDRSFSRFYRECRSAGDVLADREYPLAKRGHILPLLELIYRSVKEKKSLTEITTYDISWDEDSVRH